MIERNSSREVEAGGSRGEDMPEVIEDGRYRFRFASKSIPGLYRYVDLAKDACSCPARVPKCRHKRLAIAFAEAEMAVPPVTVAPVTEASPVAEVAEVTYESLLEAYEVAHERVVREKREAGGFRSGVSEEAYAESSRAMDALREYSQRRAA